MEVLELDGKRYVKASKAAREAGYTSDYIGQLCRSGSVDAHLVGRSWYVDVDQLANHRIEKKRNSRVKAREQVRKELEARSIEKNTSAAGDEHFRAHVKAVSYTEDNSDLLPEVRKVTIKSETPRQPRKSEKKEDSNYEIENAGEHIVHTGTLVITDLGDEDSLSGDERDTVLLSPRIQPAPKKRAIEAAKPEIATNAEGIGESTIRIQTVSKQTSFLEKIEQKNEVSVGSELQPLRGTSLIPAARKSSSGGLFTDLLTYTLFFILFVVASSAPFVESVWSVDSVVAVTYTYNIVDTIREMGF